MRPHVRSIGSALPSHSRTHGAARVVVTIYKQRQVHVQVVRQDGGGTSRSSAAGIVTGSTKRGTGAVIDLPAYENDVLNALDRTTGLPGLDAVNEVMIQRGGKKRDEPRPG